VAKREKSRGWSAGGREQPRIERGSERAHFGQGLARSSADAPLASRPHQSGTCVGALIDLGAWGDGSDAGGGSGR